MPIDFQRHSENNNCCNVTSSAFAKDRNTKIMPNFGFILRIICKIAKPWKAFSISQFQNFENFKSAKYFSFRKFKIFESFKSAKYLSFRKFQKHEMIFHFENSKLQNLQKHRIFRKFKRSGGFRKTSMPLPSACVPARCSTRHMKMHGVCFCFS